MQAMHATAIDESTSTTAEPGLRERKREATRRRVEKAAISLALEHGLENLTVDQICDESDISARTFFNYFGTKENAVVGGASKLPSGAAVEEFVAHVDGAILEDFLVMIARTFAERGADVEVFRARRELFAREPQLAAAQFTRMTEEREKLVAIVARRVGAAEPHLADAELAEEALLVVGVGMGALHVMGHRWHESGGSADFETLVHELLPRLRRVTEPSRPTVGH